MIGIGRHPTDDKTKYFRVLNFESNLSEILFYRFDFYESDLNYKMIFPPMQIIADSN